MHKNPMTMADIAREAGVSIATASRALGSAYNPRSAKQRIVRKIAQKYSFSPNPSARNLVSGQTKMICMVLPEIVNPYYSALFSEIDDAATKVGYSLMLLRYADDEIGYQKLQDELIGRRPDGLILSGGIVENPPNEHILQILKTLARYMPVVIIAQPLEGFDCAYVCFDLTESARRSVRHFHALGHRNIGILCGPPNSLSAISFQQGFIEEMQRLDLPLDPAKQLSFGYNTHDGETSTLQILTTLPKNQWPTALIARNDLIALGSMRQLDRMGLRVPEDMAIMGCDNQFYSAYLHPPLTTVDLHLSEQSRLAIHYLFEHPRQVFLKHEIDITMVIRESCGAHLGARNFEARAE